MRQRGSGGGERGDTNERNEVDSSAERERPHGQGERGETGGDRGREHGNREQHPGDLAHPGKEKAGGNRPEQDTGTQERRRRNRYGEQVEGETKSRVTYTWGARAVKFHEGSETQAGAQAQA